MQKTATELPEKHQQLFDEMLRSFNLSAKDLAQEAGISEGMISRFRQGKSDFTSANLIKILSLVPEEAKMWYVNQLFGKKVGNNWQQSLTQAPPQEIGQILRIIAEIYTDSREITDSAEKVKAV
jgi:transcriptional regulator with XRE-family HTH domain